jgi:hypothetical protein
LPRLHLIAPRIIPVVLIVLTATGITLNSLRYPQPAICQKLCVSEPCQVGECQFGAQHAGFPFPVIRDAEGGSPPEGWGRIGPEDYLYADLVAFLLDTGFNSVLLWVGWKILLLGRRCFRF